MTILSKRNYIILLLCWLFQTPLVSADYYVDAETGSNQTGDGSIDSPWQTIQHAADTMDEGDNCWIRAGYSDRY